MDDNNPDGQCMRDHYLELLWAAQKVEDRRLAELILRRLKDTALEMTRHPRLSLKSFPSRVQLSVPLDVPMDMTTFV